MSIINIYTIGFTKKPAKEFFEKLKDSGAKRVIDVRLNNVSQLAGFTKKDDLKFFLKEICDIDYIHFPELAPTQDILDQYKKLKGPWKTYEEKFIDLMKSRKIEDNISKELINDACLLCSEDKPHYCHRRLVAEYLKEKWNDNDTVNIKHLV